MTPGLHISGDDALERAQRAAAWLSAQPNVRLVFLFGSAADRSASTVRDIDLAVATEPPLELDQRLELQARLEAAVGPGFDLVPLEAAPIRLQHEIVEHGRCLYSESPEDETEFVTRTRMRYWDFKPYLDEQWRSVRARQEARHGSQG